jgi:cyclopropane-fatty-acyl-phospholipid synthase
MCRCSELSLEGLLNIDVHYAETLREWRRRFNRNLDIVKSQGFDDVFIRCWNYYLCYCEAGFESKASHKCLVSLTRSFGRSDVLGCARVLSRPRAA